MEHTVIKHKQYVVTAKEETTVTDVKSGTILAVVPANSQGSIYTISETIETSGECQIDPFAKAPALALGGGGNSGGGGVTITFDDTPTEGSTNAVTSGGVWAATQHRTSSICFGSGAENKAYHNVIIGNNAKATASGAFRCVAIGLLAKVTWYDSVAIGHDASASRNAVGIGVMATANADESINIGAYTQSCATASISLGSWSVANKNGAVCVGSKSSATGNYSTAIGFNSSSSAAYSTALGCYANNSTPNSIVLSARSSANTKFELSLVAGTATGDTGSILSDTPFVTGSTLKLTVSDGVSGISETLSIDAAALFTLLQSAGGTVTLTNPNA